MSLAAQFLFALIFPWTPVEDVFQLRASIKDLSSTAEIIEILGEPSRMHSIIVDLAAAALPGKGSGRMVRAESWIYPADNGELILSMDLTNDKLFKVTVHLTKAEFLKRVQLGMTIPQANAALDGARPLGPFKKMVGKQWVDSGIWSTMGVDGWFEARVDPKAARIVKITIKPRKR